MHTLHTHTHTRKSVTSRQRNQSIYLFIYLSIYLIYKADFNRMQSHTQADIHFKPLNQPQKQT